MKIRAVLTVVLCNVLGLLLIAVAGFVTVRFTPWGHWAIDSSRTSSAELATKYGDPVALLERGVLFHRWVTGPVIALVLGATAALLFRRAAWWVSTLSILSLVFVLSTPTSFAKFLATSLYVVLSWVAMKLASAWRGSSSLSAAAMPSPQK